MKKHYFILRNKCNHTFLATISKHKVNKFTHKVSKAKLFRSRDRAEFFSDFKDFHGETKLQVIELIVV